MAREIHDKIELLLNQIERNNMKNNNMINELKNETNILTTKCNSLLSTTNKILNTKFKENFTKYSPIILEYIKNRNFKDFNELISSKSFDFSDYFLEPKVIFFLFRFLILLCFIYVLKKIYIHLQIAYLNMVRIQMYLISKYLIFLLLG